MSASDIDGPLVQAIVHAAAAQTRSIDIVALTERAEAAVARLDESGKQELSARLRIHSLLAGKDLQREARIGNTETAAIVREVAGETSRFLEAFLADNPDDIVATTRTQAGSLLASAKMTDVNGLTPEELYQDVIFEKSFDAAKGAAGKPSAGKWIDLVAPIFKNGKALQVLNAIGYIPDQVYANNTFKKTQFADVAGVHRSLKEFETGQQGLPRERALQARAQLLKQLFVREIATQATGTVMVDVNGLWVNLEQRKGKTELGRVHAHLPYEYASEEVLAAMQKQGWLQDVDVTEARYRRAEALGDTVAQQQVEQVKIDQFLERVGYAGTRKYAGKTPAEILRQLEFDCVAMDGFDKTESASVARIPLSVVRNVLGGWQKQKYRLLNALGLAEAVQSHVAKKGDDQRPFGGYDSYDLTGSARAAYQARKNILNDPRQYDAPRIVGVVLDAVADASSPVNYKYKLFRGTIKENEEQSHSFLEIITQGGGLQRVLIDPTKHLTPSQRSVFESLPELDRSEYELLETLAGTYGHYERLITTMRELAGARGWDMDSKDLREAFLEMTQDMNAFLLMEDPALYEKAMREYSTFLTDTLREEPGYQYRDIAEKAVSAFGSKLFAPGFREMLASLNKDIERHEVTFDEHFLDNFPERFKKNDWTSDPALCAELTDVKQTIAVLDAGDREIPYVMETKAIRSLRLLQDRPLICVIGGCRDVGQQGADGGPVGQMCAGITQVAHKLKSNVVVPGTQSGIGVVLGRSSVAYGQRTASLPAAERARFFAVSPGGETYYPGNPHMAPESEKEAMAFAIGPFDTIMTPFQAGWDWTGDRKKDAPYFRHVEYAEAIYNRVSAGQPRVTIVGNGGIFTIVEAVAALKNNSAMVLVEDTGRFADLAIALREKKLMPAQGWEQTVIDLIKTKIPEHSRKGLLREFGDDPANATPVQQLYREKLGEYLILSASAKADVRVTGTSGLESTVEKVVEDWHTKNPKRK